MWIMYRNFAIFYFTCWCHVIYASEGYDYMSLDPFQHDRLLDGSLDYIPVKYRGKRSPSQNDESTEGEDAEAIESVAIHQIKKRDSAPTLTSPAYCKKLGFCGLDPALSIICLVKCHFYQVALLKPFLGLIPELPLFMCQTVNTIFPTLPTQIRMNKFKLVNLKSYFKLFNIKPDDEADFAKTSSNALPVIMIKNVKGQIFDDLKPTIRKLEIHDVAKKLMNKGLNKISLASGMKILGSLFGMSNGQFVNPKCDKTNLDDEVLMLISAMKIRKCMMDLLLPGYFVFNHAPKVASTRQILPLLKAWNMPLLMFTGVKCCLVQYAVSKVRSKCLHKYDLLNKPHRLPPTNGPDTVCNAIPSFWPIVPPAPTIPPKLKPKVTTGAGEEVSDATTNATEQEESSTASLCDDDNKNELEECAQENTSDSSTATVEYSEEATEVPEETTTGEPGANGDIESDETEYQD